jgi:hypothetical protein
MNVGEVVTYQNQRYRVGECITKTSVELVELKDKSKGLWVCRSKVRKIPRKQEIIRL